MAQKAKTTKKVSKRPFWAWRKKMAALTALVIVLLGVIYYSAFAAPAIQKADIVIRVLEVQEGVNGKPIKKPLDNVIVVVKAATPPGCPASSTGKSRTQNNPRGRQEDAIAVFWGCDTGPSAVGKKYYIESAKLDGYEPAPSSSYLFKGSGFRIKKSTFGKKRMSTQTLNMRKVTAPAGVAAPGPPPTTSNGVDGQDFCTTGTGSGGKGNIFQTTTKGRLSGPTGGYKTSIGGWIMNFADVYYMGLTCDGWHMDLTQKSPSGQWALGKITRPGNIPINRQFGGCGWITGATVPDNPKSPANNCAKQKAILQDRDNIGVDFNCEYKSNCDSVTTFFDIVPGCDSKFYFNYDRAGGSAPGTPLDLAGNVTSRVGYRYSTPARDYAVVNSQFGWGYISRGCIPNPNSLPDSDPTKQYIADSNYNYPVGVQSTSNHPALKGYYVGGIAR